MRPLAGPGLLSTIGLEGMPRKGRETVLVKLEPGASLPKETLKDRLEFFVLEGSVQDEHGIYTEHTYV